MAMIEVKYHVAIISYEIAWGNIVEEVKKFDELEDATAFVKHFNGNNNSDVDSVPVWHQVASDPVMVQV